MELPVKTYKDIMGLGPCYDPVERGYITRDWTGTALDVLMKDDVPINDRLWVVLNDGWLPDRIMHEFAVWCAENALSLIDNPDPRSVEAIRVKKLWIVGAATDEELDAAWVSAWDAARGAAWAVARGAARAVARAAARAVARGAAWAVARDAAWAVAWAVAWDAERAVAWAVAWAAQVKKLIEMLNEN